MIFFQILDALWFYSILFLYSFCITYNFFSFFICCMPILHTLFPSCRIIVWRKIFSSVCFSSRRLSSSCCFRCLCPYHSRFFSFLDLLYDGWHRWSITLFFQLYISFIFFSSLPILSSISPINLLEWLLYFCISYYWLIYLKNSSFSDFAYLFCLLIILYLYGTINLLNLSIFI